ncbi:FH1/FH2 domain-containing protein 1 [Chanos chanos]|uniref:FH1/FH2 domain-containing protein 1 n=1 Tax=Chanos chanos TaxID=29144 RepID=A0A6J2VT84_CHACN|nr:FH1/FH2 domain-containing protein 1-like [Chanos chanos]
MKQSEFPPLDQSWSSFVSHTPRLRLNKFDFSDLWDEEDLELDSTEDDATFAVSGTNRIPRDPSAPVAPPPAPPLAPPPPPAPPLARPPRSRTLKLHWKELQSLPPLPKVSRFGPQTIWAGLEPVALDTNRLEYLFESKSSNSTPCKRVGGHAQKKKPCVSVLGMKRSNIITIALSSLPPPHLLPPAVYSMDCCVLDREDVQKLQALVPTAEELKLIKEAKAQASGSSLATAEQCLLTMGDIPHLSSRLQLWAFALDYDTLEREIAEPLFHLKLAMEQLAANQTFRCILATVLAIGNFLNGCKARGFELSYLGKLSQVRDTHVRQPLLHHVCVLLMQLYPQSTDLHSEITAVTRASKCDYSQVQANLSQLEHLCKASWEQLRLLEQDSDKKRKGADWSEARDGALWNKLPKFLKECEQRIKVLRAVHRRVINRFHSFLLFLGYSRSMVRETSAEAFCKTVSDFSLEYRATRHAILQQREREKEECLQQNRLEEVLRTPESGFRLDFTLPRHRSRTPDTRGYTGELRLTSVQ